MNTPDINTSGNSFLLYVKRNNYERKTDAVILKSAIDKACWFFGLSEERVKSKCRKRELSLCRFIIFGIVKKKTSMSLKTIGEEFGGRDHSTALHGLQTLKDLMETDPVILRQFNEIEALVSREVN